MKMLGARRSWIDKNGYIARCPCRNAYAILCLRISAQCKAKGAKLGTPRSAAGYVLLSNADAAPGVVNLADIGSLEDSVWKLKF